MSIFTDETELGNAKMFVKICGDRIRFNKHWYCLSDGEWVKNPEGVIKLYIENVIPGLSGKWLKHSGSYRNIKTCISLSKSLFDNKIPERIIAPKLEEHKSKSELQQFIDENCLLAPNNKNIKITVAYFYEAFINFCQKENRIICQKRQLTKDLSAYGVLSSRGANGKWFYFGITIK